MDSKNELDRYILKWIQQEAQKNADALPHRFYEHWLYSLLAKIAAELIVTDGQKLRPRNHPKGGGLKLTVIRS